MIDCDACFEQLQQWTFNKRQFTSIKFKWKSTLFAIVAACTVNVNLCLNLMCWAQFLKFWLIRLVFKFFLAAFEHHVTVTEKSHVPAQIWQKQINYLHAFGEMQMKHELCDKTDLDANLFFSQVPPGPLIMKSVDCGYMISSEFSFSFNLSRDFFSHPRVGFRRTTERIFLWLHRSRLNHDYFLAFFVASRSSMLIKTLLFIVWFLINFCLFMHTDILLQTVWCGKANNFMRLKSFIVEIHRHGKSFKSIIHSGMLIFPITTFSSICH